MREQWHRVKQGNVAGKAHTNVGGGRVAEERMAGSSHAARVRARCVAYSVAAVRCVRSVVVCCQTGPNTNPRLEI